MRVGWEKGKLSSSSSSEQFRSRVHTEAEIYSICTSCTEMHYIRQDESPQSNQLSWINFSIPSVCSFASQTLSLGILKNGISPSRIEDTKFEKSMDFASVKLESSTFFFFALEFMDDYSIALSVCLPPSILLFFNEFTFYSDSFCLPDVSMWSRFWLPFLTFFNFIILTRCTHYIYWPGSNSNSTSNNNKKMRMQFNQIFIKWLAWYRVCALCVLCVCLGQRVRGWVIYRQVIILCAEHSLENNLPCNLAIYGSRCHRHRRRRYCFVVKIFRCVCLMIWRILLAMVSAPIGNAWMNE